MGPTELILCQVINRPIDQQVNHLEETLVMGPPRPSCVCPVAQEKGQLLENVFPDPKGFGIDPSGKYRYEMPGFRSGDAAVS